MKTYGARNKRKGSNAERLYAIKFRELGHEFCQTARYASKLYDNSKIDLVQIPYNIQIKAGIQKGLNPAKELVLMENCIKSMFPLHDPVHTYPKLLIHYRQVGQGSKRTSNDELVYMSLQQFNIFKSSKLDLVYQGIKTSKLQTTSEFKDIVWMNFEYFSENVVKV